MTESELKLGLLFNKSPNHTASVPNFAYAVTHLMPETSCMHKEIQNPNITQIWAAVPGTYVFVQAHVLYLHYQNLSHRNRIPCLYCFLPANIMLFL